MTRKRILIFALVALALVGAAVSGPVFRGVDLLEGSGTIELRNIRVGSKVGGRIQEVRVREGDRVEPGQILVTFENQELLAALEQARANLEKTERGYRPEEIAEARAAVEQAKADYEELSRGYRRERIEAAKAEVERARADVFRTQSTWERYRDLAAKGIISLQQRDEADGAWRAALAMQRNAEEKYNELVRGYRPEQVESAKARYVKAQATLMKLKRGNRKEDIEYARAALRDAEARDRERQVLAPAAATVEVLDVRPGDLIAPNTPIATLLERDQLYVRIYIPETEIGRVRLGQHAEVHVDSFSGQTFDAMVEQINQQAEFLPRNVQTREERVHQVFGVKLRINDPSGRLRVGMAADVKWKPAGN